MEKMNEYSLDSRPPVGWMKELEPEIEKNMINETFLFLKRGEIYTLLLQNKNINENIEIENYFQSSYSSFKGETG